MRVLTSSSNAPLTFRCSIAIIFIERQKKKNANNVKTQAIKLSLTGFFFISVDAFKENAAVFTFF